MGCTCMSSRSQSDSDCESYSFHSLSNSEELLQGFNTDLEPVAVTSKMETENGESRENKRKREEEVALTLSTSSDTDQLIAKIARAVREAVMSPEIVKTIQDAVLPGVSSIVKEYIDSKIKTIEDRLTVLEITMNLQKKRLSLAENDRIKTAAQQDMLTTGRHNNLVISGLEEKTNENISEIVTEITTKLNLSIGAFQAKRIGRKKDNNKPRPVLASFDSHWDRRKLFASRIQLRSNGYPNVFINEDLTKKQTELFFLTRMVQKEKLVKNTWTLNGSISVRTNDGTEFVVADVAALKKIAPGFEPNKYIK